MKNKGLLIIVLGIVMSIIPFSAIGCANEHPPHACSFSSQVITDQYKASSATCTESAKYYYSCSCGIKGADIFEYGQPLQHSYTNYIYAVDVPSSDFTGEAVDIDTFDEYAFIGIILVILLLILFWPLIKLFFNMIKMAIKK